LDLFIALAIYTYSIAMCEIEVSDAAALPGESSFGGVGSAT
jgi:hypothetical protein